MAIISSRLTRRALIGATSAFAITAAVPAHAWIHGKSIFNGGRSQTNSEVLGTSTAAQFINRFKTGFAWQYFSLPTDANVPRIPLVELDDNGYLTNIVAGTTGAFSWNDTIDTVASYSGIWVYTWKGIGTVYVGPQFAAAPGYTNADKTSAADSGGRYECTRINETAVGGLPALGVAATSASPNNIRNIKFFRKVDEAALNSGQILGVEFAARMREANPGCFRSLGWIGSESNGTNDCNMALWAHRKPVGSYSYRATEYRAAAYAGRSTNSGNDFSVTFPGYTAADKTLTHVLFNAAANIISTNNATVTAGTPGTITLTGSALQVGNAIAVANTLPSPLIAGNFYYIESIINAGTGTYTIAATRGGPALAISGSSSSVSMCTVPMLNINSAGWYPFGTPYTVTSVSAFVGFDGAFTAANVVSTVVLDLTTGCYIISGGATNQGIINGVPPEVFLQACIALGAHPWVVQPYLSTEVAANVHTVTDWMPNCATLIKAVNPGWMKPVFEPPNETWNGLTGFLATLYAPGVAWVRWAYVVVGGDIYNVYGKWTSTLGQAIAAIYGNDRTKYSMVCAIQTTSAYTDPAATNIPRIQSTLYVSRNGGDPAYKWVDRLSGAPYYSPSLRFTTSDLMMGFDYCVTYAGNAAQQLVTANTYVDSANNSAANTPYTLPYVNQCFANLKTFALAQPVGSTIMGIDGYEGAYSSDYLAGNWSMDITSATAANPCVLTVAATCSNSEQSGMAGSPAKVGMVVTPSGVAGLTQLNNGLTSGALTFTGGGSANIVGTNSFSVGDAVAFTNANVNLLPLTTALPAEIAGGKAYYVVAAGNPFQVSATKGGVAITFTAAWTVPNNVATRGWAVTAVSATTITLNFDASALAPGTGGACTFAASQALSNTLRYGGKLSTSLGTVNDQLYSNWNALAGGGFLMEWCSNFVYFGLGSVWTVLDTTASPATPQWTSIRAYNH